MQANPLANVSYYDSHTSFSQNRFNATQRSFVCGASYYTADTLVRINTNNQTVLWLDEAHLMDTKAPMNPNVFDMNMFESRLSGVPLCWTYTQGELQNQSFTRQFILDSGTSIGDIALKTASNRAEVFQGPDDAMLSLLDKVYRLTFALAHHSVSGQSSSKASGASTGNQTRSISAVVVIPVFAIASEVVIAVLTVFALAICFIYWKRLSILKHDPDSISAIASLIADDSSNQGRFGPLMRSTQQHNTEDLKNLVKDTCYRLRSEKSQKEQETCLFEICGKNDARKGNKHILSSLRKDGPLTRLETETVVDTAAVRTSSKDTLGADPLPLLF